MPWNGSGVFSRIRNWVNEAASGIPILPNEFDEQEQDFVVAGFGNCITRDGQGGPTADIPWNNFGITGLRAPALAGDATNMAFVVTATANRSMGGFRYTNLADPVNPQDAATKAWVGGTTTALPSMVGNAGKFMTNNGLIASWAYAGISTINATITTDAAVAGSYVYVPVQMAALGKSVTLPSGLTLPLGGPLYIIDNTKGTYPAGIRDSTGALLMAVAPGGEAFVTLKDNSTAAGVWSITGSGLEPGLITVDSTFSSTYTSTLYLPFVAIDANTSIHFVGLAAGGFAAFIMDNLGKVVGTPVTVTTTASSVPRQVFKIDATRAILFYGQSATSANAVVLTIGSVSPTLSLAVGAPVAFADVTALDAENFVNAPKVVQMAAALYGVSYTSGANTPFVSLSVAGAVITMGAAVNIIAANSVANSTAAYALTANTSLVLYKSGAAAPYANNAVVISVAGVVSTVNAPVALAGCTSSATTAPPSVLVSATKCIVCDDANTATNTLGVALTIAGNVVTAGAALNFTSASGGQTTSYIGSNATRYNPHLWTVSTGATNTVGLWFFDASGISTALVLSETAGTLTAGAKLYSSISNGINNAVGAGSPTPQGATDFCAVRLQSAASTPAASTLMLVPHKIAGTTTTFGVGKPLRNISSTSPSTANLTRLSSGDYLVAGAVSNTSVAVCRSNGDAINYRGDVSTPPLLMSPVIIQAGTVAANRAVYLSSTNTGGSSVSVSTDQLRLFTLEVAA